MGAGNNLTQQTSPLAKHNRAHLISTGLWDAAGRGILLGPLCAQLWLSHILSLLHEPLPDK